MEREKGGNGEFLFWGVWLVGFNVICMIYIYIHIHTRITIRSDQIRSLSSGSVRSPPRGCQDCDDERMKARCIVSWHG